MLSELLSIVTAGMKLHVGGNGVKSVLVGITRPLFTRAPLTPLIVALSSKVAPLSPALVLPGSSLNPWLD